MRLKPPKAGLNETGGDLAGLAAILMMNSARVLVSLQGLGHLEARPS